MRKGGDRKGWNRKMPMLKALTVMKRQWFAMEAKIEIPCGEKKRNQVQAKDTRSKVMIVRDAGIGNI